jgi:hypothetical protein
MRRAADVRHVERVRRKLLQLARDYGRVTSNGVKLDLPLTHALLGEMVGSERETVTRAIDQLESSGFLTRDGHYYRLYLPRKRSLGKGLGGCGGVGRAPGAFSRTHGTYARGPTGEAVRFSQEFGQPWSRVPQRGSGTASHADGQACATLSSVATTPLWSRCTKRMF